MPKKPQGSARKAKGADTSAAKAAQKSAPNKSAKKSKGKHWTPGEPVSMPVRIVLIVFIVLMALSMMLPSLTYLAAGSSSSDSQSTESSDTSSDSTDSSSDDNSADAIDSRYQALVDAQQSKLDSDPNNLAALLNMGNDYMKWGVALLQASSADADTSHAYDVLDNAIATYDKYLALNDSSAVKVDRALCQYYAGDTDDAIASLEALTQEDASYGPAWANLGMLYQVKGNTDSAKNAYNKAIAVEPNDEYGSKTFAQKQLATIAASESSSSSSGSTSSSSSSTAEGLSSTLSGESGTGL
ncbi:MAG: tetratricopeptide repeat protein [Atopobiaceae bacterium]